MSAANESGIELNTRTEIPYLQGTMYHFAYYINILPTWRSRFHSCFKKRTSCHSWSFIALNRTIEWLVSSWLANSNARAKLSCVDTLFLSCEFSIKHSSLWNKNRYDNPNPNELKVWWPRSRQFHSERHRLFRDIRLSRHCWREEKVLRPKICLMVNSDTDQERKNCKNECKLRSIFLSFPPFP